MAFAAHREKLARLCGFNQLGQLSARIQKDADQIVVDALKGGLTSAAVVTARQKLARLQLNATAAFQLWVAFAVPAAVMLGRYKNTKIRFLSVGMSSGAADEIRKAGLKFDAEKVIRDALRGLSPADAKLVGAVSITGDSWFRFKASGGVSLFKFAKAYTDVETGSIYINASLIESREDLIDSLRHEVAHLVFEDVGGAAKVFDEIQHEYMSEEFASRVGAVVNGRVDGVVVAKFVNQDNAAKSEFWNRAFKRAENIRFLLQGESSAMRSVVKAISDESYRQFATSMTAVGGSGGRVITQALRNRVQNRILQAQLKGLPVDDLADNIVKEFGKSGIITVIDKGGRQWGLQTYSRMLARTTLIRSSNEGTVNRVQEIGDDIVQVIERNPIDDECIAHNGKIYSTSGNSSKYPELDPPPYHPNCGGDVIPRPDLEEHHDVTDAAFNAALKKLGGRKS